mmetsp:Transcript_15963/g.30096  ORF Transcript_15963/g.30096 Transcript_15963/m.30096 type:complete len:136 (+) Transcript_15963:3101-3508(+)
MGIQGLTSALQQCGILPTFCHETKEIFSSLPQHSIKPGSVLAINGAGLAFYLYRKAYLQHYNNIMNHSNKRRQHKDGDGEGDSDGDDSYQLILHLLPCMIHLRDIHQITHNFLNTLIHTHKLRLHIYLDGKNQPG